MLRLILGYISAAFSFPVIFYLFTGLTEAGVLISVFTILQTIFIATPIYYLGRKHLTFAICVFIFGSLIGILSSLATWLIFNQTLAENMLLLNICYGMFSSVAFWVVGIWRNYSLTQHSSGAHNGGL